MGSTAPEDRKRSQGDRSNPRAAGLAASQLAAVNRAIAAKDGATLVKLAKDEGLTGTARTKLLELSDAVIRRALFSRKDLTETEGRKYFASETRVTVLKRGVMNAPLWKTTLIVDQAVANQNRTLSYAVLERGTLDAQQLDRLASMLQDLGCFAPDFRIERLVAVLEIVPLASVRTLLWLSQSMRNATYLLHSAYLRPFEEYLEVLEAAFAKRHPHQVLSLAWFGLEPLRVVEAMSSNSADKVFALVSRLELYPVCEGDSETEVIIRRIREFRALTTNQDPPRLAPVEPILDRLETASSLEIARVIADNRVVLDPQLVTAVACNPNHEPLTARYFATRFLHSFHELGLLLGTIDQLADVVVEQLRSPQAPRVTFEQATAALPLDRLVDALEHERIRVGVPGRGRPLLPDGSTLKWLAPQGWTDAAEEVALLLSTEHFAGSGVVGRRLLKRHLGPSADLDRLFRKMAANWEETIGELCEVVRAI
jgi:hypothetical protein